MDIVRFIHWLRLAILSFVTVAALAACAPDGNSSSNDRDEGAPSDVLTIIPPADRHSEATGALNVVAPGQASATGGVGAYTFSHDAPVNGFPLGATIVTWTVVDGTGAQSSALQTVTMSDTTAPDITAPPSMQMASTAATTMVNLGTATTSDLVDPNPVVSNDGPATGFPQGTTRVVWTATDASGNVAFATQMVTVLPMIPGGLSLTPPAAITMEATAPLTAVSLGMAIANGGTAPFSITNDAPMGGFPVGTTTVTWTVVDAAMASTNATQAITVADTTAPMITAPANVAANQGPGPGNTSVNLGAPVFSDLADPNPVVSNDAPVNGFPVGVTSVIWTVIDASANSATDTQLVTINAVAAEMCSSMAAEFVNTIYPLMATASPQICSGCHVGSTPLPTTNNWEFPNNPPDATDFDLFRTIAAIDSAGQSLILAKATGIGHAGGDRFPNRPNDPDYDLFADFVNRAAVCQPDPPVKSPPRLVLESRRRMRSTRSMRQSTIKRPSMRRSIPSWTD